MNTTIHKAVSNFVTGCVLLAGIIHSIARSEVAATPSIGRDGDRIRMTAGVLERVIRVSGGNVATERLTVSGTALTEGIANELSFRIMRAEPNRSPLEMPLDNSATALNVAEAKANDTDALKVSGQAKSDLQTTGAQAQWRDARTFTAADWGGCFDLTTAVVAPSRPGVQRVVIRGRSLKDPVLAGVSVNLIYEVYENYPVTLSAISFKKHHPRTKKFGGNLCFYIQRMKVPPVDGK